MRDRLHSKPVKAFDKEHKRWLWSVVGLFLPAKKHYSMNGPHAMERRRKQIAKGMLQVTA